MNFRSLLSIICCYFCFQSINAEISVLNKDESINKRRLAIMTSGLTVGLAATYYYLDNAWWSEQRSEFHFDDGADLTYALNVDKAGHFLGGIQSADFFSSSMIWSGLNKKDALWYGSFFGTGVQLFIEVKDAYAPYWGFSKWDVIAGSAGSFWPLIQHYNKEANALNFKFSYYKRSNTYWDLEMQRNKDVSPYAWQDDYPNQTYWAVFDISKMYNFCCWPKWLDFAFGFGIDDTQYINYNNSKSGGRNEWDIALDYDIKELTKKWDHPILNKVKHWLNYFHFPAPTIRLSPEIKFYPLFL